MNRGRPCNNADFHDRESSWKPQTPSGCSESSTLNSTRTETPCKSGLRNGRLTEPEYQVEQRDKDELFKASQYFYHQCLDVDFFLFVYLQSRMKGEFFCNVVIDERYVEVSEDWREMGDASTHPLHVILPAKASRHSGECHLSKDKTHILVWPTKQYIFEAEIQLASLTWFDLIYYSIIPRKHERLEWLRWSPPWICNVFHACQFAIIRFYWTFFFLEYQWKYFIIGCGWHSSLNAHSIM